MDKEELKERIWTQLGRITYRKGETQETAKKIKDNRKNKENKIWYNLTSLGQHTERMKSIIKKEREYIHEHMPEARRAGKENWKKRKITNWKNKV